MDHSGSGGEGVPGYDTACRHYMAATNSGRASDALDWMSSVNRAAIPVYIEITRIDQDASAFLTAAVRALGNARNARIS